MLIAKNTYNGTEYTTTSFKIGTVEYRVMVVKGGSNYVNVRKVSNNPFGICGTDFKNFDEATSHYKTPQIKLELLKIEMGLS